MQLIEFDIFFPSKLGVHREHVLKEHGPQANPEHHLLETDSSSETSSHHSEHSTPEKHHHFPGECDP